VRYIAVEGVIGVGKTALAERLADRLSGHLVLEEIEENPFLGRFYQDIAGYAFQTQLFFLLSRCKQQQELRQPELFDETIVSDYLFEKDRVFASLNLTEHEFALYEKVYELLARDVVRPDLLVYLQARTDVLLGRIRQRGRPFEAPLGREYLDSLADAYNRFFLHYDASPMLIVNTERVDFVASQEDMNDLFKAIQTTTKGRRFYSPRGKGH